MEKINKAFAQIPIKFWLFEVFYVAEIWAKYE